MPHKTNGPGVSADTSRAGIDLASGEIDGENRLVPALAQECDGRGLKVVANG